MRAIHSMFRQLRYWYWRRFMRRTRKRAPTLGAALAGVTVLVAVMFVAAALVSKVTGVRAEKPSEPAPLVIEKMGSFFAGGIVITAPGTFDPTVCGALTCPTPAGQTLHADHMYVQYHIPPNARKLPLVMWHGCLSAAWESTPDDREGYQGIFVRRGWSVYIIDQPRQGRAGKSSVGTTITPTPSETYSFITFRFGIWPNLFPGVQFAGDPASLDHFFRQGGAAHGPSDNTVSSDAMASLFARIGPGVLVTHSASGLPGWMTAIKTPNVRGIIAYEPGRPTGADYLWPEGEVPAALTLSDGTPVSPGNAIPLADFLKLTKVPIQIVMGDNIPTTPNPLLGLDAWRLRLAYAREFVRVFNRHGGDGSVLHLPEAGLHGNTHFAFADLNNVQVADLMSKYLHEKGLDKRKDKQKDDH